MSTIKAWLADPAHYIDATRRMLADPKNSEMAHKVIIRERITCVDGFSLSVQYSPFHYCNARPQCMGGDVPGFEGELPEPRSVEVGFPSKKEGPLMPYAEDESDPTGTVYGYVPVEMVDQVIAKHGGIKWQ